VTSWRDAAETAATAVREHGCDQDPVELSLVLNLVIALCPEVIVEIGCDTGGSLFAWRQVCEDVIGVSLGPHDPAREWVSHGATLIRGDSHHVAIMALVEKHLDGRQPDFVWIDGDHSEAGCRADWRFAQRLGARAVGFHDISHRRTPGDPGVRKVFAEASARYPSVTIRNPADIENSGAGIVFLARPGSPSPRRSWPSAPGSSYFC